MPDHDPSDSIEQQSAQHGPDREVVYPPTPPDSPDGQTGKAASYQSMKANVKEIEDRVRRAERWMIGLTFAIAFFALCAVIVGILQWSAMRGQLGEMKSSSADTKALAEAAGHQAGASSLIAGQAKAQTDKMTESLTKTDDLIRQATDQAKATNRLAEQTKRTADIAQRSLEVSERPWVGVTAMIITDNIEVGKVLAGKIDVLNAGRTPAIHVKTTFRLVPLCGTLPEHPHPDYGVPVTATSNSMLLPNIPIESAESKSIQPITEGLMAALKPGSTCELYGFAKIIYEDTFGKSHWRHACAYWQKGTPKVFLSCQSYNDGDEDYPDGKEPN